MLARGYKGSGNVNGGGPPFRQDTYKVTVGPKTIAFKAPDGKHWFVLGTSSTGQGCKASLAGLKGRFAIARATATVVLARRRDPRAVRRGRDVRASGSAPAARRAPSRRRRA